MGQHDYRLKSLADDELLAGLSKIVGRRNQITAEFLAYLAELDERQLFLELGYSSLFEYCVEKLGLCESTAGRHIAAARVCRNHPQVFAMVACGKLHASALSLMKKHLTPENAQELFALCQRRSARKVEELLATRFPKPDVRDLVRRSPAPASSTPCRLSRSATLSVESASKGATTEPSSEPSPRESSPHDPTRGLPGQVAPNTNTMTDLVHGCHAPQVPGSPGSGHALPSAEAAMREPPKSRRLEPLSADRYGVHFTADGEFRDLLERVRGLAGHRLPGGDLMTLMKRGLEAYERELEKERFALGRKPRRKRSVSRAASMLTASEFAAPQNEAPQAEATQTEVTQTEVTQTEASQAEGSPNASAMNASSSRPTISAFEPTLTTANPTTEPESQPIPTCRRTHHCPAGVVREVFVRDGKRCTYVSPDGRRCSARRCLELDHIDPRAAGGPDTVCNLRLRCRAHNQWYARQYFGKAHVAAAVKRSRPCKDCW